MDPGFLSMGLEPVSEGAILRSGSIGASLVLRQD